jgi:septal ring factor EnvC (AmiA/AmiB activator)
VVVFATFLLTAAIAHAALPSAQALREANAASRDAGRRAEQLDARAERAATPSDRARWQQAAVAARIDGAEAEVTAGRLRAALIGRLLSEQRARLAAEQGPVARLLAALAALARRPSAATLVQPGSIDDLVHVQAVLDATLPQVRRRTADIRGELARSRTLRSSAALAARSLDAGRRRLVAARAALGGGADRAADRGLALAEEARDTVAELRTIGDAQDVLADLVVLPGPVPASAAPAERLAAPYRLPVDGRLATGLGEVSGNGVRARGLTFDATARAAVIAPAAGRVVFARRYRGFGDIVIIDHGDGWTTLLTGLSDLAVTRGARVAAGAPVGRASPQVTVELRRRGRPVDITQLIG